MRKLGIMFISLLLLTTLPVSVVACGGGTSACEVCGVYRHEGNQQDYISINEDGSCLKREAGIGAEGEWEVHNGTIIFTWRGVRTEGDITGDMTGKKLIDVDGKVWVKE